MDGRDADKILGRQCLAQLNVGYRKLRERDRAKVGKKKRARVGQRT